VNPRKLWAIKRAAEELASAAESMYESTEGGEVNTSHADDVMLLQLLEKIRDEFRR
jgi:hypothetical protein